MRRHSLLTALSAAGLLLSTAAWAAEPQTAISPTVAVVNIPFVVTESPQFKALHDKMAREFGDRQKEVEKLKSEGEQQISAIQSGKLKGEELVKAQRRVQELQADFQLKGRALQEDMKRKGDEEQKTLMGIIQNAIDEIARERGIQLVIAGQQGGAVAYAAPVLDISDEVIARVSGKKK